MYNCIDKQGQMYSTKLYHFIYSVARLQRGAHIAFTQAFNGIHIRNVLFRSGNTMKHDLRLQN